MFYNVQSDKIIQQIIEHFTLRSYQITKLMNKEKTFKFLGKFGQCMQIVEHVEQYIMKNLQMKAYQRIN